MSRIDADRLLQPVSDEEPAGEDLSDLTEYYILEDLVAGGTAEDAAAAEPEWPRVLATATELLERGKELRVLVHLIHALVRLDGFPGLRDGLQLLDGMLDSFWESIYPQLEEDYDAPAESRMNILRELSSGAMGGETISPLVQAIREAPLSDSRQMGRFCWRDILLANGELEPPEEQEVPQIAFIDGAIRDTDEERMAEFLQALRESVAAIEHIDALLTEKIGMDNTCQIAKLGQFLAQILAHLDQVNNAEGMAPPSPDGEAGSPATQSAPVRGFSGTIGSQGDVLKALDAICNYYEKNERSSPVPLLLLRARRLVGKDFMTIIRDIARGAEDQLQEFFGVEEEEE